MAEISRPWDGTAVGDASEAPYNAGTEFSYLMAAACGAVGTVNNGGVVRNYLATNNLMVSGIASPLSVQAGDAFVNGTHYNNSAALSVVVPTPAGATRIDRIVLRKSWAAQTIRVTRVAGIEGGGIPALTQVIGTTWDIPLAQASITVGGVITVVDERTYLPSSSGQTTIISEVLTAAINVINISNIPQHYSHLKLYASLKVDAVASGVDLRFNDDAGVNYTYTREINDGVTLTPSYWGPAFSIQLGDVPGSGSAADIFSSLVIDIYHYSSTIKIKTIMSQNYDPDPLNHLLSRYAGTWHVDSAITKISLGPLGWGATNFIAGSNYTLYGLP